MSRWTQTIFISSIFLVYPKSPLYLLPIMFSFLMFFPLPFFSFSSLFLVSFNLSPYLWMCLFIQSSLGLSYLEVWNSLHYFRCSKITNQSLIRPRMFYNVANWQELLTFLLLISWKKLLSALWNFPCTWKFWHCTSLWLKTLKVIWQ